ncbi:shikimate kinase [Dyella caseinilytica]|uniref:Shikimate kinase n=1 Tax=Dyella caseinilytica TaxID=1849581 RepID=A0ABX7GVL9_9GAMM|nr:shikimate kinase [Dyella caseinilytica]QRN54499.1 shikimate kinase [Dyella caseinilytica]GFZ94708.1 shikimate kinase [Dyella caseinilytica]
MNPSSNLFLIGPTGAGKTSIGRQLAARYQLPFLDLDQEIERQTGVPISTVFEIEGEAGFRQREHAMLDMCSQRRGILLASGAGAVLDPVSRHHLMERGYVVWLQASVPLQLQRLVHDTTRPLLADANRQQKLEAMAATRTALYEEIADLVIPHGGEHEGLAAATERCLALIEQHWNRP